MRKIYCTFGGAAYDGTLQRIAEDAPRFGATDVWIYDEPWLMATDFYRDHRYMWEHPGHNGRHYGFGWYCWKPYVILQALKHMAPGEILLWSDADTYPIADFSMLYEACEREAGFFAFEATGCNDIQWVKRDVWEAVFPEWKQGFETIHAALAVSNPVGLQLKQQHATARFMLFQKGNCAVRTFLEEWQRLCTTKWLATRDPSITGPEFPGFEQNRGDQSIYSLLCHKYGIPLHREADEFGEGSDRDRGLYGQLFKQIDCRGSRADLSGSKWRGGPGI